MDLGLAGWKPYAETGIGYIWGSVKIKFDYSGIVDIDHVRLYKALSKIRFDAKIYRPKGQ